MCKVCIVTWVLMLALTTGPWATPKYKFVNDHITIDCKSSPQIYEITGLGKQAITRPHLCVGQYQIFRFMIEEMTPTTSRNYLMVLFESRQYQTLALLNVASYELQIVRTVPASWRISRLRWAGQRLCYDLRSPGSTIATTVTQPCPGASPDADDPGVAELFQQQKVALAPLHLIQQLRAQHSLGALGPYLWPGLCEQFRQGYQHLIQDRRVLIPHFDWAHTNAYGHMVVYLQYSVSGQAATQSDYWVGYNTNTGKFEYPGAGWCSDSIHAKQRHQDAEWVPFQ